MRKKSNLYILVLSNGGYDGLGKQREKEMEKAAAELKFKGFKVVDDERLQDGPVNHWQPEHVSEHIEKYIAELKTKKVDIGTLVTFDDSGISGHPNHIQVYFGCKHLYDSARLPHLDLYTLQTVNLIRKYIGFFDSLFISSS